MGNISNKKKIVGLEGGGGNCAKFVTTFEGFSNKQEACI